MSDTPTKAAVDINGLTHAEIEEFEEYAGVGFLDLVDILKDKDVRKLPFKAITALTFLAVKRKDPDVTIDDVRNAKVGTYDLDLSGGDEDPLSSSGAATA